MCRAQGISLIPQLSTGFVPHNGVMAVVSDPDSNSGVADREARTLHIGTWTLTPPSPHSFHSLSL